jgi:hypothetical protein
MVVSGSPSLKANDIDRREAHQAVLSVIVVNWNAGQALATCLASLRRHPLSDGTMDVVVVDNASADDSVSRARAAFPDAHYILLTENTGFASANNLALAAYATGKYVLLLNPDTVVARGALDRLVAELEEDETIGVAGGHLVSPDGESQLQCARSDLSLRTVAYDLFGLRRLFPRSRIFGEYRMEYWDHGDTRDVPCVSGACLLIRRQVVEEVGLLDESVPMYFEDIDYCYRARHAGWRVRYVSEARITHEGGHSANRSPRRTALFVMEEGDARWLFFRKHRGRLAACAATLIIGLGSLWRIMLVCAGIVIVQLLGNPNRAFSLPTLRKYCALFLWALSMPKPRITRL